MMDLDNFKGYNDLHGHPAGDALLHAIGTAIYGAARSEDRVYRYGGDEFALILPGVSGHDASSVAERIRSAVARLTAGEPYPVTISIGAASHPADAADKNELIAAADTALYFGKQSGGNQVVRAEDVPGEMRELRTTLDRLARAALRRHEDETSVQTLVEEAARLSGKAQLGDGETVRDALLAIARSLDSVDATTIGHGDRVGLLACRLAQELGCSEDTISTIELAARLHGLELAATPGTGDDPLAARRGRDPALGRRGRDGGHAVGSTGRLRRQRLRHRHACSATRTTRGPGVAAAGRPLVAGAAGGPGQGGRGPGAQRPSAAAAGQRRRGAFRLKRHAGRGLSRDPRRDPAAARPLPTWCGTSDVMIATPMNVPRRGGARPAAARTVVALPTLLLAAATLLAACGTTQGSPTPGQTQAASPSPSLPPTPTPSPTPEPTPQYTNPGDPRLSALIPTEVAGVAVQVPPVDQFAITPGDFAEAYGELGLRFTALQVAYVPRPRSLSLFAARVAPPAVTTAALEPYLPTAGRYVGIDGLVRDGWELKTMDGRVVWVRPEDHATALNTMIYTWATGEYVFLMIGVDDEINQAMFAGLPGEAAPSPTPAPTRRPVSASPQATGSASPS